MEQKQIEAIKARINKKIVKGDYMVLMQVMSLKYSTAKARYTRNNPEAVLLMKKIVSNRQRLIKNLRKQINTNPLKIT